MVAHQARHLGGEVTHEVAQGSVGFLDGEALGAADSRPRLPVGSSVPGMYCSPAASGRRPMAPSSLAPVWPVPAISPTPGSVVVGWPLSPMVAFWPDPLWPLPLGPAGWASFTV